MPELMPKEQKEAVRVVLKALKQQGIRLLTGAKMLRVEKTPAGLKAVYEQDGKEGAVEAEQVLMAAGRKPNFSGIDAAALGLAMNGKFIAVDSHQRTNLPGVYAIGDVSSPVQLAHVAAAQGAACVEHMAGLSAGVCMDAVPSCIYCRPEIAAVGLTEAEAKERGIPVKTGKCVMGGNARTVIADPGRCFMKVTAHAETGAILGAQLMCPNASDIIGQLGQAIANGMTPGQLLAAMRPHPTYEEALSEALESLAGKL